MIERLGVDTASEFGVGGAGLSVPGNGPRHLAGVAKEMLVSTRMLEGRLNEVGTTFREIANEVRMQFAARCIALGTLYDSRRTGGYPAKRNT